MYKYHRTYKDDTSFIVIKSKTATSAVDIGALSGAVLKFTMSYLRHSQSGSVEDGCCNISLGCWSCYDCHVVALCNSPSVAVISILAKRCLELTFRGVARRCAGLGEKIDVLMNNAGVMAIPQRQETKDEMERMTGRCVEGWQATSKHASCINT